MKPLTGEELLNKLERVRERRADVILSVTGYLGKTLNFKFSNPEYNDFFREFFWAYTDRYGPLKKLTGEEAANKLRDFNNNIIAPKDYILPPGLIAIRAFRTFEKSLQTGNVYFKKRNSLTKVNSRDKQVSFAAEAEPNLADSQSTSNEKDIYSVQDISTVSLQAKRIGQELLEFAVEQYDKKVEETSICIRSGYETDSIGQFRRAFAKAADVDLAPLSRMIAAYRKRNQSPEIIAEDRRMGVANTQYLIRSSSFRESVLAAHGTKCQVCGIEIPELIEAAHIVPVALKGVDHFTNGIPLCPTHHNAFDRYLFAFDPATKAIVLKGGVIEADIGITKDELAAKVSDEALKIRFDLFRENQ